MHSDDDVGWSRLELLGDGSGPTTPAGLGSATLVEDREIDADDEYVFGLDDVAAPRGDGRQFRAALQQAGAVALAPSSRRVVAGVAAAGILAATGLAWTTLRSLEPRGAHPASVVPATATAYVEVDLDPSPGQKLAAARLARAAGSELSDLIGRSGTGLTDGVLGVLLAQLRLLPVDASWLGDRAAIAVVPTAGGASTLEVAVAVTDEASANRALPALVAGLRYPWVSAQESRARDASVAAAVEDLRQAQLRMLAIEAGTPIIIDGGGDRGLDTDYDGVVDIPMSEGDLLAYRGYFSGMYALTGPPPDATSAPVLTKDSTAAGDTRDGLGASGVGGFAVVDGWAVLSTDAATAAALVSQARTADLAHAPAYRTATAGLGDRVATLWGDAGTLRRLGALSAVGVGSQLGEGTAALGVRVRSDALEVVGTFEAGNPAAAVRAAPPAGDVDHQQWVPGAQPMAAGVTLVADGSLVRVHGRLAVTG